MKPVPIATPSTVESHLVFLSMKEGISYLWSKDFNPCAFIQSSMLSQLDRDMLSEVAPKASMDCIVYFQARA